MTESTFDIKPDQLTYLTNLHTIILKKNYVMHWGSKEIKKRLPVNSAAFENLFKNLIALKNLEFTDSCLGDDWQLTLPQNLKKLVVDKNEYSELDVHHAPHLEEISANDNHLKKLPLLHDPLPPLKILRFQNNPLEDMTILTLAPLCQLQVIQLKFPSNTRYSKSNSEEDYCECYTLVSWIKKENITGVEHVQCSKPSSAGMCNICVFYCFEFVVELPNYFVLAENEKQVILPS